MSDETKTKPRTLEVTDQDLSALYYQLMLESGFHFDQKKALYLDENFTVMPALFDYKGLISSILRRFSRILPDSEKGIEETLQLAKKQLYGSWFVSGDNKTLGANIELWLTDEDINSLDCKILYKFSQDYWALYQGSEDQKYLHLYITSSEQIVAMKKHAHFHSNLANAYQILNNQEKAVYHALQAIELQPQNPVRRIMLSVIYAKQGKNEPALNLIEEAIETFPKYKEHFEKIVHEYNLREK